ncbi:iron uptake transporter permease EfeU [Patulibacter minatonensis]|uniref:iron uptake transporter permease EfeU n=1 Tax=Patulibacter minatonensis TaxID=298163 RepID=UPI0004B5D087|nr:iron uptake transporter permease EfeU [Patulibacter minatonensis]
MIITAALPTVQFVTGLREGVEASLIVGIIAAFLVQEGRKDALRWMWLGVLAAVAISLGVAVTLHAVNEQLPQKQQEQLETVIALVAVVMVTGMILWMRKNARTMSTTLRTSAASALAAGSAFGLVGMAFLAVLREGVETAFFLVAQFQLDSSQISTFNASAGALVGIIIACAIGWGIYRGGVKLNLTKFFRFTAVFLVIIAAGLVAGAMHTAHEAGWVNFGQEQFPGLDLSAVVSPDQDNIFSGLVTGLFGIQPRPSYVETIGWLVYALPMLAFVLWPAGRPRATNPRTESEVPA